MVMVDPLSGWRQLPKESFLHYQEEQGTINPGKTKPILLYFLP
jgi:hypothetical protein